MWHIHQYSQWRTDRYDTIQNNHGMLASYIIQSKYCDKCGKGKLRIELEDNL